MREREPGSQETGSSGARRNLERHIGQIVRKLRRQQNLTIAEIARKAEISSGMLSKIENSQTSASLDTLASLRMRLAPRWRASSRACHPRQAEHNT